MRLKKDPNNPGSNLLQIESVGFSKIGSDIGGILGRSIGRLLFKDDTASFVSSAVFGALGQQVGGYLVGGETTISAIQQGFEDVTNLKSQVLTSSFATAAIGTVSSFLSVELADALGLDGDIGKVFGSVTSSLLDLSFQNALNNVDVLTGLKNFFTTPTDGTFFDTGFANALGSTLASYFAVKLGSMIYSPQTQSGVTLSSIGSAVGGWAFGSAAFGTSVSGLGLGTGIGSWFAGRLGGSAAASWLGLNVIAPGLGILIGFVLGALIGDLFGKKKQRTPSAFADAILNVSANRYELGTTSVSNGGNIELARNMATITQETLNGIIETIASGQKAKIEWGNGYNLGVRFGHTSDQLWVKLGGQYGAQTNVTSADEAVDKAVLWALPNLQIAGGNMFLKRAVARSQATSVAVLSGDMQIAEDYGFYLQNRAVIDAAIAEPYISMKLATVDYLAYVRINALQLYKDDPSNTDPNAKDLAKMRAWGERKVTEWGSTWVNTSYAVGANVDSNFYDANKAFMTRALAKDSVALDAGDQAYYNANQVQVDRITSRLALTQFAASWIITLQRAAELKINQASASDFFGGAQGFADSLQLMSGSGLTSTQFYEEMQFKFDGTTLRTHYRSDGGNRIRGADGNAGTGVLRPWWSTNGVEIQRSLQIMDGENAFVLSKPSGFQLTDNGQYYSGSVAVGGGETALEFHSVRAGQTIGFSMEVKSLDAGTKLDGTFQFLDANWNVIPVANTWTSNEYGNTSEWQKLTGTYVAPANAVFAVLQVQMRRPANLGSATQSGAVRRLQISDLPAGATTMPAWSGSGFGVFDQANFLSDVGYSSDRSSGGLYSNNFLDDSAATSNVSLVDVFNGGNDVFLAGSGNDYLGSVDNVLHPQAY